MNLRKPTPLELAENDLNRRVVRASSMRREMINWDKKLSKLNDEMLYYVLNRASKIIEHRIGQQI